MTALLALALAVAPGCPEALEAADRARGPEALAASATGIVRRLERAGGPTLALAAEADALAAAERGPPDALRLADGRFRARLRHHCDLAAAPASPGAPTPADRRALDGILARPEFGRARADPFALSRWLHDAWRRLLDLLGTTEAGRYATSGRALFLAAVAIAAAAALASILRGRRAAHAAGAPELGASRSTALEPPEACDALADAALAGGRASEAVRHSFRALLASLERSGRVPRGRALTNRELATLLGASGDLSSGFSALASLLDGVVYGGIPVAAGEARAFLGRSRTLRDLVDGSEA